MSKSVGPYIIGENLTKAKHRVALLSVGGSAEGPLLLLSGLGKWGSDAAASHAYACAVGRGSVGEIR